MVDQPHLSPPADPHLFWSQYYWCQYSHSQPAMHILELKLLLHFFTCERVVTRERLGASKLTRKSPESAYNYILLAEYLTSNKHTFLSDITHPQQLHVIIIIILIVPDVQEAVVPHVRLVPANVRHQRIVAVIVLIREMRVRAEN